ncbi:MAG TPA: 3-deoxy-manno-octulosonate cytidylyltransferase [Bacteroidales bacterium]|nr:3-deoxy-manno-octulosonate cytidylyltransferase [Bacteroidales bacterium]
MQKAIAIIPARYASTRFPGKPLVDIQGKSMIMRVYAQAAKADLLKNVFVATDDRRIYDHVIQHQGQAIMTAAHHNSGTERCLEAFGILVHKKKCTANEIILNIQGDEPFIEPAQIDALVKLFERPGVNIASLIKKMSGPEEINNPDCVKVVATQNLQALYFSRSPIPFIRDLDDEKRFSSGLYFKHIGMYAYRSHVLSEICSLQPSPLEKAEKLEQLRWLENGFSIHLELTAHESIAIDSPGDLLKVTNIA